MREIKTYPDPGFKTSFFSGMTPAQCLLFALAWCIAGSFASAGEAGGKVKFGYTTQNLIPAMPVSVDSAREQLALAKNMGFSWIELRDPDGLLERRDCETIATDAGRQGLQVLYSVQRGLLAPDFRGVVERALRNAPLFDGPRRLRVLALRGDEPLGWNQQEFETALESARWAAEKAQTIGFRLMIENADVTLDARPHDAFGMRQLLDALDPAIELQLDTGNLFTGPTAASVESARNFIRDYADRISYVHLKSAQDGVALPFLGPNPLPLAEILDRLGKGSSPLYAAVELNSGEAEKGEVLHNMRKSLDYLREIGVWKAGKATSSRAIVRFIGEGEVGVFEPGVKLFTDRDHRLSEDVPEFLIGEHFLRYSFDRPEDWFIIRSGELTVLTAIDVPRSRSRISELEAAGFTRIDGVPTFQLFGEQERRQMRVYRKRVAAGERYSFGSYVILLGIENAVQESPAPWAKNTGELLYNGIRLPERWPPRSIDPRDTRPMPVPYLQSPPDVISIDLGRQLFIDDFLIASTTLKRIFHKPEKYSGNPVLKPETPIELGKVEPEGHEKPWGHGNAGAVPKSGECWWDPADQVFKLWYETSWFGPIALATSKDGIHWERPEFDVRPGTNIVSPPELTPDSWTVVHNWHASEPDEKWTLFLQPPGPMQTGYSLTSADGIHWSKPATTGDALDRSTHFYNPFRRKWVYSIRAGFGQRGRTRTYYECDDFMEGAWRSDAEEVIWLAADDRDGTDYLTGEQAQLYNFDAVAYESIMLGQFQLHWGPPNEVCEEAGLPKITELQFAYSRDGFHFHRPDRRIHIPAERTDVWDRGYVQSLGNVCTIMGDKLYFYFTGFRGNPAKAGTRNGFYDNSATGLAMLRRDGFASMEAGHEPGFLITRPVSFTSERLFVNLDAPRGSLRVEILDLEGNVIEPFSLENSEVVTGDATLLPVTWKDGADLSMLRNRPVRFRFELENGSLYAFWVSRDESGRSDGYVAGGGPGYTGPTDTVGRAALGQ